MHDEQTASELADEYTDKLRALIHEAEAAGLVLNCTEKGGPIFEPADE